MQKWEYLRLLWFEAKFDASYEEYADALRARGIDWEEEIRDGERYVMHGSYARVGIGEDEEAEQYFTRIGPTIAELGQEGWEMAGYSTVGPNAGAREFFFKRPVE